MKSYTVCKFSPGVMCKETLHPTQRNKRIFFSLMESMVALADWKRASENVSLPFSTDATSRSDSASSRPLAAKISSCTWTRQGDVDFCNGSIALLPQEATWLEVPSLYKAPALLRPNCSNFHGITRPALGLPRLPIFESQPQVLVAWWKLGHWRQRRALCSVIHFAFRSLWADGRDRSTDATNHKPRHWPLQTEDQKSWPK